MWLYVTVNVLSNSDFRKVRPMTMTFCTNVMYNSNTQINQFVLSLVRFFSID
jgi:hypothetical protein